MATTYEYQTRVVDRQGLVLPPVMALPPHEWVRLIQTYLRLDDPEMIQIMGISGPTLQRWRNGDTPQGAHKQRLKRLYLLLVNLSGTFNTAEAIGDWMHRPARYLGVVTPAEALRVGHFDDVEAALEVLNEGIAS